MNDTPQGDGNTTIVLSNILTSSIRMNDTPQGDGNLFSTYKIYCTSPKPNKNE